MVTTMNKGKNKVEENQVERSLGDGAGGADDREHNDSRTVTTPEPRRTHDRQLGAEFFGVIA